MAVHKSISLSSVLIVGAMVVAAPRYVGLFANSEGWRITGMVWDWVVALSGVGMALLEGVATWWMWNAWAETQPSKARNALGGFMVASGTTLLVMVAPYVAASSSGLRVSQVLGLSAMWVWSIANALAPILVMAGVGLAEKLRATPQAQPMQHAIDVQVLRDEMDAKLAAFARNQTLHAVQVNVGGVQQDLQPSTPHEVVHAPAQLSSGMTFEQGVAQLKAQGVPVGATTLGEIVGKHKSTAGRWLAQHPEVRS